MMKQKLATLVLALSLIGMAWTTPANAQTNRNHRTLLTFSQPVEVPGTVLPAGTYTFELNDSMSNRHIVHIFDEGGTKLMAIVLAVPNRRMTATDETVITFAEVPAGQPQAVRYWYYPGQVLGHEMVYPATRAHALSTSVATVPSVEDTYYTDAKVEAMRTAEIAAARAAREETPVVVTTPAPTPVYAPTTTPVYEPTTTRRTALPRTASALPLLALFGFGTLAVGMTMRRFSRRRDAR